ncbi:hypothetical protein D9M68_529320 [compost metagenome]
MQAGLAAPARVHGGEPGAVAHVAGAMPRQQGRAQHVHAAVLARSALGQGAQPGQRGARHGPFVQRPAHGDVEGVGGLAAVPGQGLAQHPPGKGRFRLELGRHDGVAALGMRLQGAGRPSGRGAPFRPLVRRYVPLRRSGGPLCVAPLRHNGALRFEGLQQPPETRRQIREARQHQLPGRGQAPLLQRPQHPRIALIGVFRVDARQRLAIALAPFREAAVFIGVGARRDLELPLVHEQVRIHGQARGLAGVQQDALGLFRPDRLGPYQLRGEAVEPVSGHAVIRFEREFIGRLGQPGG